MSIIQIRKSTAFRRGAMQAHAAAPLPTEHRNPASFSHRTDSKSPQRNASNRRSTATSLIQPQHSSSKSPHQQQITSPAAQCSTMQHNAAQCRTTQCKRTPQHSNQPHSATAPAVNHHSAMQAQHTPPHRHLPHSSRSRQTEPRSNHRSKPQPQPHRASSRLTAAARAPRR